MNKSKLHNLIKTHAINFGNFNLFSGKSSHYYVDLKKVSLNSEFLCHLGEILFEMTKDMNIQAVGGLETGAIPIVSACATGYSRFGGNVNGFFVRKQIKKHGSGSLIEGIVNEGDRVVVVDDVFTTGKSAMQAVKEIEKIGAKIVCVICVVDRLKGAKELFSEYNYKSIFAISDFELINNL